MGAEPQHTVLTIEDDAPLRQAFASYLQQHGFEVLQAADGEEGLAAFQRMSPQVVLIDLRLPGISGFQVLETLTREAPDIPTIVVSGTGDTTDVIRAIHAGAWDYVVKPITDLEILCHAIRQVVERAHLIEQNRMTQRRLEDEVAARTAQLELTAEQLRQEVHQRELAEQASRVQHQLNETLLDSLPYPALLVRADRTILAANAAARRAGATVGGNCWQDFGSQLTDSASDSSADPAADASRGQMPCTFCQADRCLVERASAHCPQLRARGRIWDTWWIPLDESTLLHFTVDVTEQLAAQQSLEHEVVRRKAIENRLRAHACQLESANAQLAESKGAMETAAADLAKSNEELKLRNVELDEFAHLASHDLQEPLRKLVSFSKLLQVDAGSALSENAKRDLDFITLSARRMHTLVQDLLRLSRAGRTAIHLGSVSLGTCAADAVGQLSDRVLEVNAEVVCEDLPEVVGDARLLTQVYHALLGNALKFVAPGRRPQIHLTAEHVGDHWVFGVRDNGIGIRQEYTEQVFAPFRRLHGRDEFEGTGIGLAICRKAVERHGGRIWVESTWGEGTCFKFTLATSAQAESPDEQMPVASPAT